MARHDRPGGPGKTIRLHEAVPTLGRTGNMAERELQGRVLVLAASYSVLAYHTEDSRRSIGCGFPDLVLCGIHGTLFRELKSNHGDLSSDQRVWRNHLQAAGMDWAVWRPRDLAAGVIETQLQALARARDKTDMYLKR